MGSFCAYRSPEILFNDISCVLLNFDVKKKHYYCTTETSKCYRAFSWKYIYRMYLLIWIGLAHLNYVSEPDGIKFHFMNSATHLHIGLKIWPKTVMNDHYLSRLGLSNFISKNSTTWPLNSRQTYKLVDAFLPGRSCASPNLLQAPCLASLSPLISHSHQALMSYTNLFTKVLKLVLPHLSWPSSHLLLLFFKNVINSYTCIVFIFMMSSWRWRSPSNFCFVIFVGIQELIQSCKNFLPLSFYLELLPKYYGLTKIPFAFFLRWYEKTWMDFLVNPMLLETKERKLSIC